MNRNKDCSEKGERIAKHIAASGLCSRRDAEKMIADRRVAINGQVLDTPACFVRPEDIILVDGNPLPERSDVKVFLYYKPAGLITTHKDEKARKTVFDSLPGNMPRVVSVGRLDIATEGLLILTTSGELERYLESPQTGWLRRYRVRVYGKVNEDSLKKLKKGITIDGVKYGGLDITVDTVQNANAWLTISLREGKNREIRKVMGATGLQVNRLIRTSYGPFQLGKMTKGSVREVPQKILKEQIPGFFRGRS